MFTKILQNNFITYIQHKDKYVYWCVLTHVSVIACHVSEIMGVNRLFLFFNLTNKIG